MKEKCYIILKKITNTHKRFLLKHIYFFIILFLFLLFFSNLEKVEGIRTHIKIFLISIYLFFLMLSVSNYIENIRFLYRYIKKILISVTAVIFVLISFLVIWYEFCFYPDDQKYLDDIVNSVKLNSSGSEVLEYDLIKLLSLAKIKNEILDKDLNILLSNKLFLNDFYINKNPYNPGKVRKNNNLKFATGKISHFIHQKNSLVLKSNSAFSLKINKSKFKKRLFSSYIAFPSLFKKQVKGELSFFFKENNNEKKKLLFKKNIEGEIEPRGKYFKHSSFFSSILFYLKNPGRSSIPKNDGWLKVDFDVPLKNGEIVIEFTSGNENNDFIFLGNPRIYGISDKSSSKTNIVYLIFDQLAKNQLDLYHFYNSFKTNEYNNVVNKTGRRKIITPNINRYANNIALFEKVYSYGQTTRPSITSLWTSYPFNSSRLPIFRNIVTEENAKEYYDLNLKSLGEELSKEGYITKQIGCNAEGHDVAGIGIDLGFDENYDYTMETSEYAANFKQIMNFLDTNQKRKFFLYGHLNIPHPPRWVSLHYYLPALWDSDFNHKTAVILANIRYMDDSVGKILKVIENLELDKNTLFIISADHSMGYRKKLRGRNFVDPFYKNVNNWESLRVAPFAEKAIYTKKGDVHLHQFILNIPFVAVLPKNLNMKAGVISSKISSMDIAPTLYELTTGKRNYSFHGKSFKTLFFNKDKRSDDHRKYIPFTGRFQRGFIFEGRYKYWKYLKGLYKYKRGSKGEKLIQQQEFLFDLKKDPWENNNLARQYNNPILTKARSLYIQKYIEFPDKNFVQFVADKNSVEEFKVIVKSKSGKIIYPKKYGDSISIIRKSDNHYEFRANVSKKNAFISFETFPTNSDLEVYFYKDNELIPEEKLYYTAEKLNLFGNPLKITNKRQSYILRKYGKTGLEPEKLPGGSICFSRIPLNYWLEMSLTEKDVNLNPGIKEVLKGWGYIQ